MEESTENGTQTTASPNRNIVILLVVIIVLLAAAVAYFVFADGGTGTGTTTDTTTGDTSGSMTTTGTMSQDVAFDAATATVVEEGVTPEQHVTAYFDAVLAGDYTTAFKMLPTSKQAEYGDEAAFASQLTGYGITSFTIDSTVENGEETEVTATAAMPGGNFSYLWTFVKDGDNWLVKSRTLPGMN
ncbi:MAG: hypothetical protein Q7W51_00865 [Coriobacteriia bacterium]|nr:hypothetical protein [Coriobacteriia bacterium]